MYGRILASVVRTDLNAFGMHLPRSPPARLIRAKNNKSKEDEQTLEELNSAHHHSQSKCQLVQTSYIKRIKLFLFSPYNKHLINRAKSV